MRCLPLFRSISLEILKPQRNSVTNRAMAVFRAKAQFQQTSPKGQVGCTLSLLPWRGILTNSLGWASRALAPERIGFSERGS